MPVNLLVPSPCHHLIPQYHVKLAVWDDDSFIAKVTFIFFLKWGILGYWGLEYSLPTLFPGCLRCYQAERDIEIWYWWSIFAALIYILGFELTLTFVLQYFFFLWGRDFLHSLLKKQGECLQYDIRGSHFTQSVFGKCLLSGELNAMALLPTLCFGGSNSECLRLVLPVTRVALLLLPPGIPWASPLRGAPTSPEAVPAAPCFSVPCTTTAHPFVGLWLLWPKGRN